MLHKQILRYLDFMEKQIRIAGGGFVRLETYGSLCRLIIQVSLSKDLAEKSFGPESSALRCAEPGFMVKLMGRDTEGSLCNMRVQDGKGRLELQDLDVEDLGGSKVALRELVRLIIEIDQDHVLSCEFQESMLQPIIHSAKTAVRVPEIEDSGEKTADRAPEIENSGEKTLRQTIQSYEENKRDPVHGEEGNDIEYGRDMGKDKVKGDIEYGCDPGKDKVKADIECGRDPAVEEAKSNPGFHMSLRSGKWEQLDSIYPHIMPFGDERSYLKITPADFVVLKDRSYRLANNSFLLHGYFNYKHLILHRIQKRGEYLYYIGVPGNFYPKEKEIAMLFGFESFETKEDPAREGEYGYYMMRVEL